VSCWIVGNKVKWRWHSTILINEQVFNIFMNNSDFEGCSRENNERVMCAAPPGADIDVVWSDSLASCISAIRVEIKSLNGPNSATWRNFHFTLLLGYRVQCRQEPIQSVLCVLLSHRGPGLPTADYPQTGLPTYCYFFAAHDVGKSVDYSFDICSSFFLDIG